MLNVVKVISNLHSRHILFSPHLFSPKSSIKARLMSVCFYQAVVTHDNFNVSRLQLYSIKALLSCSCSSHLELYCQHFWIPSLYLALVLVTSPSTGWLYIFEEKICILLTDSVHRVGLMQSSHNRLVVFDTLVF